jgi:hypothetical protein
VTLAVTPALALVWEIAVEPTVATLPQAVLDQLTKGVGFIPPEPIGFTVEWTSAPGQPSRVSLHLELLAGPSIVGTHQQMLLGIQGKLSLGGAQPREWAIEQENFGTGLATAIYLPDAGKLTLIVPASFALTDPTRAEKVHALLLIPCRLQQSQLSCPAPRLAFRELVARHFPHDPKAEEALPSRLQGAEDKPPASTERRSELGRPLMPPRWAACCLHCDALHDIWTCSCPKTCLDGCPLLCQECEENECINRQELPCWPC